MSRKVVSSAFLLAAIAAPAAAAPSAGATGSSWGWVILANVVIWGGIALYVLYLHGKVRRLERDVE